MAVIQATTKEPEFERFILADGRADGSASALFSEEPWPQACRRPAGFERHYLRQPQWAEVARCAEGVWPGEDTL